MIFPVQLSMRATCDSERAVKATALDPYFTLLEKYECRFQRDSMTLSSMHPNSIATKFEKEAEFRMWPTF